MTNKKLVYIYHIYIILIYIKNNAINILILVF